MKLPNPLYYFGGTTKDFKEFWSQREHVHQDKKWHYQRLWTDEQVVEMVRPLLDKWNIRFEFALLISQLRGGRDG